MSHLDVKNGDHFVEAQANPPRENRTKQKINEKK
jgi:hypothetical protein